MAKTIHLDTKNNIGIDEAKRRISAGFERLKVDYVEKIGNAQMTWTGDVANIGVKAMAQEITAQINVTEEKLAIDITLPWLLAGFAPMIQSVIVSRASAIL